MQDVVTTKDAVIRRIDPGLRREYRDAREAHELAVNLGVREHERAAHDRLLAVEARFLDAALVVQYANNRDSKRSQARALSGGRKP